ncbi:NAD(P)/FAD-dependent oxidoreductase [Streptomyces boluensis]|uniref:FAD-dependent oxidoreductase n=1 Tax=Streptomyces boluensis TaxID=1775135 RepID=A0A964XJF7_9ACTN|nr:FAD-binding oxidoreductase [Streptomyces boluensis]NBE50001.1 FAD-dependent oxidoreductase [Streptomyces boluensis]
MTYLPGSGWVDRPTTCEPGVAGDVSCDVVVIGGGLGGMAAALRLADLGRDVVLVEADICGWGASARNAGYLTPTLGSDPRILKHFYADRARGLYRFANNAVSFTEELIESHAIECGYRKTGNVAAAPTAAAFRRMAANVKTGKRAVVADARELGIPPAFPGGLHIKVGGILNPGELSLGVREVVRASAVRTYEQSPVLGVADSGGSVTVELADGRIRASHAILTTNAFTNGLDVSPRRLSTPVWVTAVETEPVPPDMLDAAGWTSRTPITTNHFVMQSFRPTNRGTVVFTSRRLQTSRRARADRVPDQRVVDDLVRGFRERFPTLAAIAPARAWGGWIGLTPSNMAVVGQATPRISYSLACNGHGLPQAPYLGTLLADHVAGKGMHDDLSAVWRDSQRFAPGVANPVTLRLGWLADRLTDRLGSVHR